MPGAVDESKRACVTLDDVAGPVAIDGAGVFVRTKSSILRADLQAKQTRAITSVTSASVEDLAAGNGTLYWNDEASLSAASEDGTNRRSLDTAGKIYGQIKLDAQSVYFLRDGQVVRLPR